MAGLDVTHQFQATPARIASIGALPGVLAAVLADLLTFFSDNYRRRHDPGSMQGAAVHDPLAVLALAPTGPLAARHVTCRSRLAANTHAWNVRDRSARHHRSGGPEL